MAIKARVSLIALDVALYHMWQLKPKLVKNLQFGIM